MHACAVVPATAASVAAALPPRLLHRLVSAAVVPATGSRFANLLLWLPAAATVQLPMRLDFA